MSRMMGRMQKDKKHDRKGRAKRLPAKKRSCRFCVEPKLTIDYKEGRLLQPFITERGRIVPRRISGNCSYHQREVTLAVKRARIMALVSFTAVQAASL